MFGNKPSDFSSNPASGETQDNRPVEKVNWYMAIAYCNKLSIEEGKELCYSVEDEDGNEIDWEKLAFNDIPTTSNDNWNKATCDFTKNGYRLPTEAEWEIAARGGATGGVYAGTAVETKLGGYAWYTANAENKTHEVKKKKANGYGLYDMSGNVWEWCWDWYGDYTENATDPTGASAGSCRVDRGGGCSDGSASYCRASFRYSLSPDSRYRDVGFRLARSVR